MGTEKCDYYIPPSARTGAHESVHRIESPKCNLPGHRGISIIGKACRTDPESCPRLQEKRRNDNEDEEFDEWFEETRNRAKAELEK